MTIQYERMGKNHSHIQDLKQRNTYLPIKHFTTLNIQLFFLIRKKTIIIKTYYYKIIFDQKYNRMHLKTKPLINLTSTTNKNY